MLLLKILIQISVLLYITYLYLYIKGDDGKFSTKGKWKKIFVFIGYLVVMFLGFVFKGPINRAIDKTEEKVNVALNYVIDRETTASILTLSPIADTTIVFSAIGHAVDLRLAPGKTVCFVANWDRAGLSVLVSDDDGISFVSQKGDEEKRKYLFFFKNTNTSEKEVTFELTQRK